MDNYTVCVIDLPNKADKNIYMYVYLLDGVLVIYFLIYYLRLQLKSAVDLSLQTKSLINSMH